MTQKLIWIILFPLIGSLINGVLGRRLSKGWVSIIACSMVALSFLVSLTVFFDLQAGEPEGAELTQTLYRWIESGTLKVDFALRADALSALMILVVTGVGLLIHIYSVGYMHADPGFSRYFSYLNLFTFAMLLLVLAKNLLLLFVGWEGVGLCSYLLIGFWFERESASYAGKKAFVVNRIGDFGFLMGLCLLFWALGKEGIWTLDFKEIQEHASKLPTAVVVAVCLLLFVGAAGKSAQIPLYVWLPDAMAGPTPVSALIHAATMVTAGVYLVARCHFLYDAAPDALQIVAIVGCATAFFAATIALVQNDIKKVLAYSTVSQLGFMFLAAGVGAYSVAIFHLMTHAFFKALLFMGAGSVIHGLHDEQDIRKMGGIWRHMPMTAITFILGGLSLAGFPAFAGFFSKDAILYHSYISDQGHPLLFWIGIVTAFMTACYIFRLIFLVFFGKSRVAPDIAGHIHESSWIMTLPLILLAVLAIIGGWVGIPEVLGGHDQIIHFLDPAMGSHGQEPNLEAAGAHGQELRLMAISTLAGLLGILAAGLSFSIFPSWPSQLANRIPLLYRIVFNKYYIDEIYQTFIVQPIRVISDYVLFRFLDAWFIDFWLVQGTADSFPETGETVRKIQTGNVGTYARYFVAGAILLIGYFWLRSQ